ncbi:MAG: MBL fold metallo-hydrolase [Mucilaginibacter sp.]|nr:MBL fold metallo-hydrolase [Mucilaginibacter sp.]
MNKRTSASPLQVTYIGGPTVIIEIDGLKLMTDPTLDPQGTSFVLNERVTETKLTGPAIMPEGPVDIVLLSHDQHFDNLDGNGRSYLKEVRTTLTTKSGAGRLNGNSVGLAPGESLVFSTPGGSSLEITATPARHGPAGVEKLTGDVIGFHLRVSGNHSFEIYITGDTVYYHGVEELARHINPAYVFIFAGAARPRGPFNVTMGTNDALDTAYVFPSSKLIPLHAEGWSHYTEHNSNLIEAFNILGIAEQLMLLKPGVRTSLTI